MIEKNVAKKCHQNWRGAVRILTTEMDDSVAEHSQTVKKQKFLP